jgi:hypothetical protein
VSDHLVGFLAGNLLAALVALGLDLEAGSFDGDDKSATLVVVGRAGTRVRVSVTIESADEIDH